VVGGGPVEAHGTIRPGGHPVAAVERRTRQGGDDFGSRQIDDHRTKACQDLSGESREADAQAVEIVHALDRLAIPAAHLLAGVADDEVLEAELASDLVEEFLPAAEVHPGLELDRVRPKGDGGEESVSRVLALPVVGSPMVEV